MRRVFWSRRFWLSWRLKKREELNRWSERLVDCRDSKQNKNLKKNTLEKIEQPSDTEYIQAEFEQEVDIPLESSSVSLVLEKLFIVGWLKNDSKSAMLFASCKRCFEFDQMTRAARRLIRFKKPLSQVNYLFSGRKVINHPLLNCHWGFSDVKGAQLDLDRMFP